MTVNGLPLPRELLALMASGRWTAPVCRSALNRLFPENDGLYVYSVETMECETRHLYGLCRKDVQWRGEPDAAAPPGDIDPRLAVLIADLGLGYDQPFALDYRVSLERPRVVTLRWGDRNRWVVVAPDILAFADLLGL